MRYLAVVLALTFAVGTMAVAQACSEHQGSHSDTAGRLKRIGARKGRR
jgi:predicted lysophospholipase L1 biosynthesis ABC-type transport system permease subunit